MFIGTNPFEYPQQNEGLLPGAGSLALIEAATRVKPIIIGKPEAIMKASPETFGTERSQTIVAGKDTT